MSRPTNKRTEIARLRCAAGMLQKEVADKCGVSTYHFRMVENGKRKSEALLSRARKIIGE